MAASGPIAHIRGRPNVTTDAARAASTAVPAWARKGLGGYGRGGRFGFPHVTDQVRALVAPGQSAHIKAAVDQGEVPAGVFRSDSPRFASFPPAALPGAVAQRPPPVVPFRDIDASSRAVRRRAEATPRTAGR